MIRSHLGEKERIRGYAGTILPLEGSDGLWYKVSICKGNTGHEKNHGKPVFYTATGKRNQQLKAGNLV